MLAVGEQIANHSPSASKLQLHRYCKNNQTYGYSKAFPRNFEPFLKKNSFYWL